MGALGNHGDRTELPGAGLLATGQPRICNVDLGVAFPSSIPDVRQHMATPPDTRGTVGAARQHCCHAAIRGGRTVPTTQVYEGTNQIQRMVIAKKLGL